MKKEISQNTLCCDRMMMWRTICIVAAVPFLIQTILSFTDPGLGRYAWPKLLPILALIPMLFYMFLLAVKMNGVLNAFFHVLLTIVLTPFFLVGPFFIPLLVRGDARRLVYLQNSDRTA